MSRKCPPGVICFENTTIAIFLLISGVIIYLAYMQFRNSSSKSGSEVTMGSGSGSRSGSIYDNDPSRSGVYVYPPVYGDGGSGSGGNFLDLIPRYGGAVVDILADLQMSYLIRIHHHCAMIDILGE